MGEPVHQLFHIEVEILLRLHDAGLLSHKHTGNSTRSRGLSWCLPSRWNGLIQTHQWRMWANLFNDKMTKIINKLNSFRTGIRIQFLDIQSMRTMLKYQSIFRRWIWEPEGLPASQCQTLIFWLNWDLYVSNFNSVATVGPLNPARKSRKVQVSVQVSDSKLRSE